MNEFENRVSTLLRECADSARPYDQLDQIVGDAAFVVAAGPVPRAARRWAVLAAAGLVVIAGLYVVAVRPTPSEPAQEPDTSTSAGPLLFPPGAEPIGGPSEIPPGRFSTLLSSPTGALYVIDLFENSWGSLPPGTPTRTLNGQVFGDFGIDGTESYALIDVCSMTITRAPVTAQAWDEEVVALLSAETSTRGQTSVVLPSGWSVVTKPAELVTSYEYTVENAIGGLPAYMWVAPGTDVSAVFGWYGVPTTIERADFDGHQAWFTTYPGTNAHLSWTAAGNAYDIAARGASEQDLIAFARTLQPASISQLKANSEQAGGQGTPAIFGSTVPADPQACDPRALTAQPAG